MVTAERRIAGNTFWQALNQLSNGAGNFALAFILGRGLGLELFGLYAIVTATAQTFIQLFDFRLQDLAVIYLTRFKADGDKGQASACLRFCGLVSIFSGSAGMALLYLTLPWTSQNLVHDPGGYLLLGLAGFTNWLTQGLGSYQQGALRALAQFQLACLSQLLTQALRLLGSLALVYSHRGVLEVMIWLALCAAVSVTMQELMVRRASRSYVQLGERLQPQHRREFLRFIRTNYLIALSGLPIQSLDLNFLSYVTGAREVGQYRLAKTLMGLVGLLGDAAVQALQPELVLIWSRGRDLTSRLKRITRLGGVLGLTGFGLSTMILPPLVRALLGPDFDLSTQLFFYMAWGVVMWSFALWLNPLLMAAGRIDLLQRGALISGLVVLVAYLYAIPRATVWGAALVTGASWPIFVLIIGVFALPVLRQKTSEATTQS